MGFIAIGVIVTWLILAGIACGEDILDEIARNPITRAIIGLEMIAFIGLVFANIPAKYIIATGFTDGWSGAELTLLEMSLAALITLIPAKIALAVIKSVKSRLNQPDMNLR